MNAPLFDQLTASFAVASRRRALKLLAAALAGGVAVPFTRRGPGSIAQEDAPAATPVAAPPAAGGPAAQPPVAEPAPPAPATEPETCTTFVLAGGPSPQDPIHVDDDLVVLLNDQPIFEDADGVAVPLTPLWFQAAPGDQLTVVVRDVQACGRQIGPLWLHCAEGGAPRFLSGGFDAGCDPDADVPDNFYRDSWRI